MKDLFARVIGGGSLDAAESAQAFNSIMSGEADPAQLEAFLAAQAARGPTIDELIGAAGAMRSRMRAIAAPPDAIDLCGTGGDGHATLNVSTAVSFVVAGYGVPVAKHGNRSATSRAGAADVLQALGANIDLTPAQSEVCLKEAGLCFLFAQTYHPAMRHVAAVRKRLKTRTIFNLLGPLCNPAGVRRQLIGVYAREWVTPLAQVLASLGAEKAWVVHGSDGLDEITTTGGTHVAVLDGGRIEERDVSPSDAGLAVTRIAALKGGDAEHNARAIRRLLEGEAGAFRDIVLLNAAAALIVAGKAHDLREGAEMAAQSLDLGRARDAFRRFIAISTGVAA